MPDSVREATCGRTWLAAGLATATLITLAGCQHPGSRVAEKPSAPATPPTSAVATPASSAAHRSPAASPRARPQRPVPVERNPPGDIPDDVAFVSYRNALGGYAFVHPEGWAQVQRGPTVLFTDKLNGIYAARGAATSPPSVATARQRDVAMLQAAQPAFELRRVTPVTLPAGRGVLVVYRRNSPPDPVTGRVYRDEVERYEVFGRAHEVVLELFGPVGADNVDPYRVILQSLRLA
jgi:hypothetical protein